MRKSKAFQGVVVEKLCGPNMPVTKLECIGHIQRTMGARLRRLVKEKIGTKLRDSKPLGGRGYITKSEIEKVQNFYGLVLSDVNNLVSIKRAVLTLPH
jgi:hypothetical protein